jgi:hypothetical protein
VMSVEERGIFPSTPDPRPSFCFGIFAANDLNERVTRRQKMIESRARRFLFVIIASLSLGAFGASSCVKKGRDRRKPIPKPTSNS